MLLISIFFVTGQLTGAINGLNDNETIVQVENTTNVINYLAQYYNTTTSDVEVNLISSDSGKTVYSFHIVSTGVTGKITELERGDLIIEDEFDG